MKTAYVQLNHAWPAKIVLIDAVLERIEEIKKVLQGLNLKTDPSNDIPWLEEVTVNLSYGTNKWEKDSNNIFQPIRTSAGPVLSYGARKAYGSPMRTIDEVVYITVSPDASWIEDSGEEGLIHTLGYGKHIEDIPEVFFSEDLKRFWKGIQEGFYEDWKYMMEYILEDMPEEHRKLFFSQV